MNDLACEAIEVVSFAGKGPGHLVAQRLRIVIKPQSHAGECDFRAQLGSDCEIVPAEPQLPQQASKRARFRTFWSEIRERMQADVVIASSQAIERIQPADRVMP